MALEDIEVKRGSDGRLVAGGWQGYGCASCDAFHIELLDHNNKVFAVTTIEGDEIVELGNALLLFAAHMAKLKTSSSRMQ